NESDPFRLGGINFDRSGALDDRFAAGVLGALNPDPDSAITVKPFQVEPRDPVLHDAAEEQHPVRAERAEQDPFLPIADKGPLLELESAIVSPVHLDLDPHLRWDIFQLQWQRVLWRGGCQQRRRQVQFRLELLRKRAGVSLTGERHAVNQCAVAAVNREIDGSFFPGLLPRKPEVGRHQGHWLAYAECLSQIAALVAQVAGNALFGQDQLDTAGVAGDVLNLADRYR